MFAVLGSSHHLHFEKPMQDHTDGPVAFCCYTFLLTLKHKVDLFTTYAKMKVNRICVDSPDRSEMRADVSFGASCIYTTKDDANFNFPIMTVMMLFICISFRMNC